jgi:ADP-ribose pyrophosphatase YjhB (NUDIX family)
MENKEKPGVGVGIMIFKEGKVLLGLRNSDAVKASSELHGEGTWTMPGGKLHFHEGPKEAAIREVLEETGIRVKELNLISVSNEIVPDKHFITLGFFCSEFEGEAKVMEPDEIIEWQWFDLNNLPLNIFPPSLKVVKNYLANKIYQEN